MINVPKLISPTITELQALMARCEIRQNNFANDVHELRAKKLQGESNIDEKQARTEMALAGIDIPATNDVDAQLKTAYLNWEAAHEARESLKPKLAAAKRDAAITICTGLKPAHDAVMARLVSALVDAHKANVELFGLRGELKDKAIGYRCGVCELLPDEVLGAPTIYSPLADFFRAAVAADYLKSLPAGFLK